MLFLFYLVVRTLARLVVSGGQRGRDDGAKALEILVLRYQLRVLQRTSGPPKFRARDQVLLAVASRAIPRGRWVAFLVSRATLLRWHRELVRAVIIAVAYDQAMGRRVLGTQAYTNDQRPATITDVARRAHVSITTVSHVFSGKRPVAEGTRRRVLDATRDLQYRPAVAARGLATGRAMALGLQFPMEGEPLLLNPYFPALIESLSAAATRAGFSFVLLPARPSDAFPLDLVLHAHGLDAAIVVDPTAGNDLIPALRQAGLPVVTLGRYLGRGRALSVDNDHAAAIHEVVGHLHERGYHRHALISLGEGRFSYIADIERGFRDASAADSHPLIERAEDTSERSGYASAIKLLTRRSRPDAIVAAIDRQAMGVLSAARELGLRVPEDVGVVGEGDTFLSRTSTPPLTSIDVQSAMLGAAAIDLVRRLLDDGRSGSDVPATDVIVPARLVVRESTGGKRS